MGIAKPLFGTTATHAAVLFADWGDEEARKFFRQLKANAQILSGNKQVALAVGSGELAFGLTDTDDAMIEKEKGRSVAIVYPDQEEGGLGRCSSPTRWPSSAAAPTAAARRLVDYLLSPEVETRLAAGPSAQFPLNSAVSTRCRAAPPQPLRHMAVDFPAAAAAWDSAAVFLGHTRAKILLPLVGREFQAKWPRGTRARAPEPRSSPLVGREFQAKWPRETRHASQPRSSPLVGREFQAKWPRETRHASQPRSSPLVG